MLSSIHGRIERTLHVRIMVALQEGFFKNIVSVLNAGIDLVFYPVERDPPDTGEFPVHKNHRDGRVILFENITDMRRHLVVDKREPELHPVAIDLLNDGFERIEGFGEFS